MVSLVKRKIKGHMYYYLVWMKRKGKKVFREKQIYVGSAEKIHQLLSQELPKFTSYSYGELALLLHVANISNFVNIVNKHLRKVSSIGDYLLLPVINRLIKPTSKEGIKEWYDKSCLPLIWNKKVSLSSQNYYYYLDRIDDKKIEKIWEELLQNAKKKLNVGDSSFLFDPTNFFTYIDDHEENELPQNGFSKQKRNDKNQINLSLMIGEQSLLPYYYGVYAGNVNDKTNFEKTSSDLVNNAKQYSKEKITLVFDKGNNTENNLKAIKDFYFVGSLPKEKTETRDLLDGDFKFCYENTKKNEIKSISKESEVYGIKCKIVVSYNEKLKKKQLHVLEDKISKTQTKFKEIEGHLFKNEKAAINRINEILPKKQNPFNYEVVPEGEKFKLKLNLSEGKVAWYRKTAGKNIIFTNHLNWNDQRIIEAYRSMHKIENQFKILHGALLIPIKPIYHWTDQKIKAHVFLCMVSLLFARMLEHMCKSKIKGDFRHILEFASSIRIALVQKDGKPKLIFEELDVNQQGLMEAFSLSSFVKK
ncbi:IS1634 family transposase [Candidatus Woesearchaeota archaeon]|nr:IS1634 family transposase [Candidatus Woesearchaeota archaeon]